MWDWYDAYMDFCAIQPFRSAAVVRLMQAVYLISISTEQQFKGISKRFWDAYREKLELEYDPKQMRMVRRAGASSITDYSTDLFKEWETEIFYKIFQNVNLHNQSAPGV
jgi:hypothetical protein